MRHLRQCLSEDIFTQTLTNTDNECCNSKSSRPSIQIMENNDDDYSDPSFIDYSDDEFEEEEEFQIESINVDPVFEVTSRGDPHDASIYIDLIALILQSEEPRHIIEHGSIEKIHGSKIKQLRYVLGEWLFNLSFVYISTTETLFQAFSLFDRFLSKRSLSTSKLQLFCCCCLWICSKIELHAEDSLEPLFKCCHNKFNRNDFIQAELEILSGVDYDIHTVTPYFFVQRFNNLIEADERMIIISKFLCESSLLYIDFSYIRSSVIGFCSIAAACLIFECPDRIQRLKDFAQSFSWPEVRKCFSSLLVAAKNCLANEKSSVVKKFEKSTVNGVPNCALQLIKSVDFGSGLIQSLANLFGHSL